MTKEDCLQKIEEMIPDVVSLIRNRAGEYLGYGAIELEDYEDDYVLPKIFIYAVADEIKFQFKPLYAEHLKEAKNLTYFL